MAEFKVDMVRYHYSKTTGKLEVWCFNDEKAYAEKYRKRMARYDFGRKPDDEEGNPTDKKQKLLIGLYREPYQDGWKYTVHTKTLPMLTDTVFRYLFFGFQENEDGKMEPFTYLRHNRKALGIHYLFERYIDFYKRFEEYNEWYKGKSEFQVDLKTDFRDFYQEPYFPTPEKYDGYNIAAKWDGKQYFSPDRRYK